MLDVSKLTFVATQAALRAGDLLRKGFGTNFTVDSKPGRLNLVTEYDRSSENCIIATILKHFPTHNFLAEESGSSGKVAAPVTWIIDPLDGTVNFAHNIPVFSISIAAAVAGKVVCGVVYQPMTSELFVAEAGHGAYLNGSPLTVSSESRLENSLLATGFPYNVDENPLDCIGRFCAITKIGIHIRRLGSAAIDLAYVAAGRFEAYWEVTLQPWDFAAGKLLVEEAGGRVTQYDGTPHDPMQAGTMLASNRLLHDEMMKRLTT